MRYALALAYDGTEYAGWQIQPNAMTIQQLVEEALHRLVGKRIRVHASGRTDAGVHALMQVAHFDVEEELDASRILRALQGLLPTAIRVQSFQQVPEDFHARFSAKKKEYHYHLCIQPVANPFTHLYSWHHPRALDFGKMQEATRHFVGRRDFTSFANSASEGSASRNAVRTLSRCELVVEPEWGDWVLIFQADGFLYQMVRNIVGCLVEVGRGRLSVEEISLIFAARDRRKAPRSAPAKGLFLVSVEYEKETSPLALRGGTHLSSEPDPDRASL